MRSSSEALNELDTLSVACQSASKGVSQYDRWDRAGSMAIFRAGIIVWTMAVLEEMFGSLGANLRTEIAAIDGPSATIIEPLAYMASPCWVDAGGPSRSSLLHRSDLRNQTVTTLDKLAIDRFFKDGRTVDSQSFEALWIALGLTDNPFLDPTSSAVLDDFKRRRNNIAHGSESAITAGRSLTTTDLLKKVSQIRDVVEWADVCLDDWINQHRWRP